MADADIKVVGLSSPKKTGNINSKVIGAIVAIIVLALGVIAGIFLVRQQQDIREKASECVEQCPGPNGALMNCHPPDTDGGAVESLCNLAGKVEFCGTRNYCCPSVGGQWTADLTKCAQKKITSVTASPSAISSPSGTPKGFDSLSGDLPSASPIQTASPLTTKSPLPTARATISATATSFPIPETGINLPTTVGVGVGVILVLISMSLAL